MGSLEEERTGKEKAREQEAMILCLLEQFAILKKKYMCGIKADLP